MRIAITIVAGLIAAAPAAAAPWCVSLPETTCVRDGSLRLGALSLTPVLTAAVDLVVAQGGRAGTTMTVSRQGVLRQLVTAGLAEGVRFSGADRCVVIFGGQAVDPAALRAEAERLIRLLLPAAPTGAPEAWLELEIPTGELNVAGPWTLRCNRREPLSPGRSQIRLVVDDGWLTHELPITVTLHAYGQAAVARLGVARDRPLTAELFDWQWVDLADAKPGLVVGSEALAGASAARTLAAGDRLRTGDLKPTPVVMAGDPVEIIVSRGGVSASVRGFARQAGCLGQTIPVRNELTGRLVNARVAGPGLVEWRR